MSIRLFMFYLRKRLVQAAQKSECQQFRSDFALVCVLFFCLLLLLVFLTISPHVVLCISHMNPMEWCCTVILYLLDEHICLLWGLHS